MTAYYNEHDPFAAAWLRELIKDGLIAPGDVDERDIQDVAPNDLTAYTQVHCFAGIGGWSLALRLAGWPDDRPVWTGSAPCQPFSAAGTGGGFADERHLWPAWFWLIRQCQPVTIFGEQVSSKAGLAWWDVVATDLEATGYGCGAFDLCAAGAGAFHIRQRLYFVADSDRNQWQQGQQKEPSEKLDLGRGGSFDKLGDAKGGGQPWREASTKQAGDSAPEYDGHVGDAKRSPCDRQSRRRSAQRPENANGAGHMGDAEVQRLKIDGATRKQVATARPKESESRGSGSRNFWANAVWLQCTDGKARPAEPTIQPLAHGVPNRVGTLRGAGNAIVPQLAAKFIGAYLEAEHSWQ